MTAPAPRGAARGAGARADGLAEGVARLRRALRRGARVASPGNPLAVAQLELLSVVAEQSLFNRLCERVQVIPV